MQYYIVHVFGRENLSDNKTLFKFTVIDKHAMSTVLYLSSPLNVNERGSSKTNQSGKHGENNRYLEKGSNSSPLG